MATELAVHITQRAQPRQAVWLRRLLEPVAAACLLSSTPPVEIRPTGRWGGWTSNFDSAPDGRVCISGHIFLWSYERVVSVYLHETTHRLLERNDVDAHGPQFFCLNSVLLLRSKEFFRGAPLDSLKFYDVQDRPESLYDEPGWRGMVINWSFSLAAELAITDAPAEDLVTIICDRWESFILGREAKRLAAIETANKVSATAMKARSYSTRISELVDLVTLWRMAAGASCSLFLLSVCLLFLIV